MLKEKTSENQLHGLGMWDVLVRVMESWYYVGFEMSEGEQRWLGTWQGIKAEDLCGRQLEIKSWFIQPTPSYWDEDICIAVVAVIISLSWALSCNNFTYCKTSRCNSGMLICWTTAFSRSLMGLYSLQHTRNCVLLLLTSSLKGPKVKVLKCW